MKLYDHRYILLSYNKNEATPQRLAFAVHPAHSGQEVGEYHTLFGKPCQHDGKLYGSALEPAQDKPHIVDLYV